LGVKIGMEFLKIDEKVRTDVNKFLQEHWFSTDIIIRGKIIDMTSAEGIVVYENNTIIGLVTYEILNGECEILSLDSINEKKGIGTDLVQRVIDIARTVNCYKIKLITTNDNINAIKFYQKRGFDMVKIYHNALEISRQLKPSIPLFGEYDIPLKHEIEFEMLLFK
jgi:GNAT superfamily N-acetyltransferase